MVAQGQPAGTVTPGSLRALTAAAKARTAATKAPAKAETSRDVKPPPPSAASARDDETAPTPVGIAMESSSMTPSKRLESKPAKAEPATGELEGTAASPAVSPSQQQVLAALAAVKNFRVKTAEEMDTFAKVAASSTLGRSSPSSSCVEGKVADERSDVLSDDEDEPEPSLPPPKSSAAKASIESSLSATSLMLGDKYTGPLSPASPAFTSNNNNDDGSDSGHESDSACSTNNKEETKRVAFAKKNPLPLSPLSIKSEYTSASEGVLSPMSYATDATESMLSPRSSHSSSSYGEDENCDDDRTYDSEDWEDGGKKVQNQSLLNRSKRRAYAGITPRKAKPSPQQVISTALSDESEASLMVLMRYMGCTPVEYGKGESQNEKCQRNSRSNAHVGREFLFDNSDDEDDNSLLSNGEDTEDEEGREEKVDDRQGEEEDEEDAMALRTNVTYREEGVEMGIQDLVISNIPLGSPLAVSSILKKHKSVLTVNTGNGDKEEKAEKDNAYSERVTATDGVLSDAALHMFLSDSIEASPDRMSVVAKEPVNHNEDNEGPEKVISPKSPSSAALLKYRSELQDLQQYKTKASDLCGTSQPAVLSPSGKAALEKYRKISSSTGTEKGGKEDATGTHGTEKKAPTVKNVALSPSSIVSQSTASSPTEITRDLQEKIACAQLYRKSAAEATKSIHLPSSAEGKARVVKEERQSTSPNGINSSQAEKEGDTTRTKETLHKLDEYFAGREGKLEESPTTASDKENGDIIKEAASSLLPPVSPTKQSVREVDDLLSKTRSWLVNHRETKTSKTSSSSPLGQRAVMGNITAKSAASNLSAATESPKGKVQVRPLAIGSEQPLSPTISPTSLMTQVKKNSAKLGLPTSPSSIVSGGEGPKKSIMAQLEEIRAKQKVLELRQKAKQQQEAA